MQRNPSEITPWYGPARGFSFSREVQPVLDKYCAGCHDGRKRPTASSIPTFAATGPSTLDLAAARSGPTRIISRRRISRCIRMFAGPGPESDYFLQKPLEYHAGTSELVQILEKGHYNVKLDAEAWDRLNTWIDLNVPDHGTWSEHRAIARDYHDRRLAMRTKYANRPEDPEAYPTPAPASDGVRGTGACREPIKNPKLHAAGWPFNGVEAKRRQEAAAKQLVPAAPKPEMTFCWTMP